MTLELAGYADTTVGAMATATTAGTMGLQHGTMYALTGMTGTIQWATAGIVVLAKSGLDYRKYKKGELTED